MGDAGNSTLANAVYQQPGQMFGGSPANLPIGWRIGGADAGDSTPSVPSFFEGPGGRPTGSLADAWGQSGQAPTGFDAFGPTSSGGTPMPGSFGALRGQLGGSQPLDPEVLEFLNNGQRTHMSQATFDAMRASPGGFPGGFVSPWTAPTTPPGTPPGPPASPAPDPWGPPPPWVLPGEPWRPGVTPPPGRTWPPPPTSAPL